MHINMVYTSHMRENLILPITCHDATKGE